MTLSFDDYLGNLTQLTEIVDPTLDTPESQEIRDAGDAIDSLTIVDKQNLAELLQGNPHWFRAFGLAVGLSQEKLKMTLRRHLGSSGWITKAKADPGELVDLLDTHYNLVELLEAQRNRSYSFGEMLVERAGSRRTAQGAANAGKLLEDALEEAANEVGLDYELRTRFVGRSGRTAPCDLAIPGGGEDAVIVVAAKAFDSTGSKLTDAMKEVEDMSNVRKPTQFVLAAIDGIGWMSRQSDLQKIHDLWADGSIDGMYTLSMIEQFKHDLAEFASLRGL